MVENEYQEVKLQAECTPPKSGSSIYKTLRRKKTEIEKNVGVRNVEAEKSEKSVIRGREADYGGSLSRGRGGVWSYIMVSGLSDEANRVLD